MATSNVDISNMFNEMLKMVNKGETENASLFLEKLTLDHRISVVEFQDDEGKTLFHHMVTRQNVSLLEKTLAFIPEDERLNSLSIQDSGGDTPLHHAVMKSDCEMVKCILNSLPDDDDRRYLMDLQNNCVVVDEIPPSDIGEQTAVHLAHRDSELMCLLLFSVESSSDRLDLLMTVDAEGNSPFHICFRDAFQVAFESLNKEDQAILCKMKDSAGKSKLLIEVGHDSTAVVKTILGAFKPSLRYELCANADNRKCQAIHFVRSSEMISLFVEMLSYPDFLLLVKAEDCVGNTRLHGIADMFMYYDHSLIAHLLKAIQPKDRLEVLCMKNKNGYTVCHSTVLAESTEVMEHILRSITSDELEPLLISVVRPAENGGRKMREDVAQSFNNVVAQQYSAMRRALFRRQQKSPAVADDDWGDSCLHYAAIKNDHSMLTCILDACPPCLRDRLCSMKDIDGFTANDWISVMTCSK